ncbi:MAG: c-type cytochrome [Stellaceae bacterium]
MKRMTKPALLLAAAALALSFGGRNAAAESGEDVFTDNCAVCHSPDAGTNKLGPSLFGVVGRKAGAVADYTYTPAAKNSGITWDAANLDKYITNPQGVVPGTKMLFPGIKSADDRKALIGYLSSLH